MTRVLSNAVKKYLEFQDLDPKEIGEFSRSLQIPYSLHLAGEAKHVLYRSKKWGEKADYIHEHEGGVKVYLPSGNGKTVRVPLSIRNAKALVKLGDCLGFAFDDGEGEVEAIPGRPLPELYTIPSGRALFVIEGKKKLVAMIWGGKLGVEARGIVG